jgi:hypothetical protein
VKFQTTLREAAQSASTDFRLQTFSSPAPYLVRPRVPASLPSAFISYCKDLPIRPKLGYAPQKNAYCRTVMENQLGFIVKLLLISALISLLIKYAFPYLAIPGTDTVALIIVLLPTVIMAIALLWRFQAQKQN